METTASPKAAKPGFFRRNGLSVVFGLLFVFALSGQIATGMATCNAELLQHGHRAMSLADYFQSGHFLEATFENWESEFLQMALFVVLTVGLRQRGSSESKDMEESEPVDEDPRAHRNDPDAPWPVRHGGSVLKVYEHSLSLALFGLFALSLGLHAWGGLKEANAERALHELPPQTLAEYVGDSEFWFQSFQNWQSEFLAVLSIVLLSIVLRQRGSAQSKPVAAPHESTGGG
jgi:hypothetical protein